MTKSIALTNDIALKTAVALTALVAVALLLVPSTASAATYAYVANTGEVKTVIASDWMTAIASALDIHNNSGVAELLTEADIAEVVGAVVQSVK